MRLTARQAKALGIEPMPKKAPRKATRGPGFAQEAFKRLCTAYGLPRPEPEWKFAPRRKWRFDWAWPYASVALEIDGGAFSSGKACPACGRRPTGRHTTGAGFLADQEKQNAATLAGWRVYHCCPRDVQTGKIFTMLRRVFGLEAE